MRTRLMRGALAPFGLVVLALVVVAGSVFDASAQTPLVPYYGKNNIRYDRFDWHIYTTEHFEIYYYPEMEDHLERLAGYAESAYQQVSSDLKHDLASKVPLVLFKTHSEFEQQNIIPGGTPEGVGAFAEPERDRMVLPIDEPPDRLYGLIVHELTHIFEFDIIPRSLIRRSVPLWVDEGLSDYERGDWAPLDLMTVRDAAVADIVPKMSETEAYGDFNNPRLVYNLGHAVFEFMEARWGKEGIRQFLFSMRKNVIGGGESPFEESLRLKADEFDEQFDKYLKDRFKPFRDKERPADYGRNLAPNPEKTRYTTVLSIEPSPSGDLIAAMTGNRKDQELDIILISAKDGQVIRNLTSGFDTRRGFEYISYPGEPTRFNAVPWMSWSPVGDRLAYVVRTEKGKTLVLQNILTREIEQRVALRTVDEPESPSIAPDGRTVVFAALRGAVGDIFTVNLDTQEITNLTNDAFTDYAPVYSPDGTFIVYLARVSGNHKLFRLDLATGKKTQITFGTHDDGGAKFVDDDTIVFPSTAVDPNLPIGTDTARNGNIYNIWTLDLRTGELKQYTDALGGNVSPIVLREGDTKRIAFITYFKGSYALNTLIRKDPIHAVATSDFGAPGQVIDFQAPLQHTLVASKKKKKGTFEKLFVEGRPPVNVGVTSGGDIFGGSQITFADVLGDQQFSMFAASISEYRTVSFSYFNLARRLQYGGQGFSQTLFYYGYQPGVLFDPVYTAYLRPSDAIATRTVRGGNAIGVYPINRYSRVEFSGGVLQYREEFADAALDYYSQQYQQQAYGAQIFRNGTFVPFGLAYTRETTIFREFGPLAGHTMRLEYEIAPKIGSTLSRQTADIDARYYLRFGTTGLLALRARGFRSWGEFPDFFFFGGNSEMHGYDYLEFVGHRAFFANAELRFPLIELMATPIGVLGGIRGVFFANIGGASFNETPFKFATRATETVIPTRGYVVNRQGTALEPDFGQPVTVTGLRLKDGRASYGMGLETFALGFPIHFDWSWRTLFNKEWEDVLFAASGGSAKFRRPRLSVWVGYDF